jgi:hypothetical protein
MGEKSGVVGADSKPAVMDNEDIVGPSRLDSSAGKAFHEDVTSNDFSTARRYFPRAL